MLPVLLDLLVPLAHLSRDLRVPLERQELQVLQEILDRLGRRVRLVRQAQPEIQDPQVLRALREAQVQQDLKVLQEVRERLDRQVQQAIPVPPARRVKRAQPARKVQPAKPAQRGRRVK